MKKVPPHGTKQRFWRGCQCTPCRSAVNEYRRKIYFDKAKGIERKPFVKSGYAKAHLRHLGSQRQAAKRTGVGQSTISRIFRDAVKQIRVETERKILRAA